jgi:hypothetical protein
MLHRLDDVIASGVYELKSELCVCRRANKNESCADGLLHTFLEICQGSIESAPHQHPVGLRRLQNAVKGLPITDGMTAFILT